MDDIGERDEQSFEDEYWGTHRSGDVDLQHYVRLDRISIIGGSILFTESDDLLSRLSHIMMIYITLSARFSTIIDSQMWCCTVKINCDGVSWYWVCTQWGKSWHKFVRYATVFSLIRAFQKNFGLILRLGSLACFFSIFTVLASLQEWCSRNVVCQYYIFAHCSEGVSSWS